MGFKTQGGMWCDQCQRLIPGQKGTRRARNTLVGLTAIGTGGLSLLAAKVDSWHCPHCGALARNRTENDDPNGALLVVGRSDNGRSWVKARLCGVHAHTCLRRTSSGRVAEERPDAAGPLKPAAAQRTRDALAKAGYPVEIQYPAPRPPAQSAGTHSSADELAKLAELHRSGALSDEEFAAAKRGVLGR